MQHGLIVEPMGARLRVRLLSMEGRSAGGIIIPEAVLPGSSAEESPEAQVAKNAGPPTLQLAEITAVGEGQWNQGEGRYNGSRFRVGERILFRCGPMSQAHLDFVHASVDGKGNECLIQESLVAARLVPAASHVEAA